MRKVVTGVLAILILGTGGYFGARGWAKQRVEQEVETSLAAVRAVGASVTHGAVDFDLLRRKVSLLNVVAETGGDAKASLRIGRIVASGIGQPHAGRVSADRLEITDLEIDGTIAVGAGLHIIYKIPRLEFVDYSGPTVPLYPVDAGSPLEAIRAALQQFVAITATSLTIPTLTVSLAAKESPLAAVEYGYSGIVLRNIGEGRVASTVVDRMVAAVNTAGLNGAGGFTAEIVRMETLGFDVGPILAVLSGSADNQYRRIYQKVSTGPYTVSFEDHQTPIRMQIDGFSAEDVALKPSKFPLVEMISLFASLPRAGEPVDPQRTLALFEMVAGVYDGIRIGDFELRGMHMTLPPPQDPFSLAAIRLTGFENGRLAELSIEGLEARTPQHEPIKIGRFALRGLGLAELLRSTGRLARPGNQPTPDELASLLRALEGIEIKGLTAPYQNTGRLVEIETANISWGQFVGPIPSRVRATLHITGPIMDSDGQPFKQLAAAGFTTANIDLDAGAAWTESTRTLTLSPWFIKLANVGSVEAKGALNKVPASIFSLDQATLISSMPLVEAGPIEIIIRDLGGVDIAVADFARKQNVSADEARRTLVESVTQPAAALVPANPDLAALADATAHFIEARGGTLTIKITPKNSLPLLQVFAMAKDNPAGVLAQFRIEATMTTQP
jgi:hypothetical protein